MADDVLYDDGRVCLDRQAVTLRRYYFPLGRAKRIPYGRIAAVEVRPMGWRTGRGRLWGSAHPRYWLPLDAARLRKDTIVVLDLGARVHPTFSPDQPELVAELVRRQAAIG